MSHFYLTLPSNSSESHYPDNTMRKFTTHLPSAVSLSSEWEVGLVEISFPRTWYTVRRGMSTFVVTCLDCPDNMVRDKVTTTVLIPNSNSAANPTHTHEIAAYESTPEELHVKIPNGYYESIESLIYDMNTVTSKAFTDMGNNPSIDPRLKHDSNVPKFKYIEVKKRVDVIMNSRMKIKFPDQLLTILGFDKEQNPITNDNKSSKTVKGNRVCDLAGGIHCIYVYCDILERVPVGDTLVPLLRIVDAHGRNGEMLFRHYDQPIYVPVQKKNFDSIEVDIRDCFGDPIPFENGQLTVTLHFRLSKNPYFL
jgi:hypothetical protein